MSKQKTGKQQRAWYSVSVVSVRRFIGTFALLGAIGLSFVLYQRWEMLTLESRAERVVDEATERINMIELRDDIIQVKNDHRVAWELLDEAKKAFAEANYARALERGERSLIVLDTIERTGEGSIRVLSSQGSVEYRRGERGSWKRLRNHDTLSAGDWVKTSTDGSAELLFADGSFYTLRQSTMLHLGGSPGGGDEDKETNIAFGRVELNTSTNDRTVTTPRSEARVKSDSEALVAFDRDRESGRFAAFSGGIEVRAAGGETRKVGALQQVEQLGERLSEIKALPGRPTLSGPADALALDLDTTSQLVLAWEPVKNARRYALRISNSRLFASTLIDDPSRAKTSARLGLRGEGQFYWQVAAVDSSGARGPWSETRSFHVTSVSRIDEVNDRDPPALDIVSVETYGDIVIVDGKTESGATVTINKQAVLLKSDGSFRLTIQMSQPGWNVLEVVSTDAWKNSSTERVRVFIDA